MLSTVLTEY
ncbi:Protein of unknown function [Bacillus wiedmannii]|uniref:Uncharacterized protein n=1 Tax=Bacillus wiedmannii TaxID=1890302 RepID=A0A1C4FI14_9BACI|nr:Protein of unknown function [Bacillus wiedmannii]